MSKIPAVLIVILNYGTYDLTISLIKQLHSNLNYQSYDIMVVDNCSPNESSKVLEGNSKVLNYIFYANKNNAGYAAGNNIGIRYGINHGYEYTWILNSDVEIQERNVLDHMVAYMENNFQCAAIGPKIYSLEGNICYPYCRRPNCWNMTIGIVQEKKYRKSQANISNKVYRLFGCCMLLRNKTMAQIDCMDERTFLYGEEDILAERLLRAGYYTYYDADVSVIHMESVSMQRMSKNKKKMQVKETTKSMKLYLSEYRNYPIFLSWLCIKVRQLIVKIS